MKLVKFWDHSVQQKTTQSNDHEKRLAALANSEGALAVSRRIRSCFWWWWRRLACTIHIAVFIWSRKLLVTSKPGKQEEQATFFLEWTPEKTQKWHFANISPDFTLPTSELIHARYCFRIFLVIFQVRRDFSYSFFKTWTFHFIQCRRCWPPCWQGPYKL